MDIGALSLIVTVGLTLVVTGVLAAGWRHKFLIWGMIGGGALIIAVALFSILPQAPIWLTHWLSNAASPSAWFSLAIFIAALVVFYPLMTSQKQRRTDPRDLANVVSPNDDALLENLSQLRKDIEKSVNTKITLLSGSIAADAKQIAEIKRQIAIDMPNASTVGKAFKNLDDAVHAKVNRIREETQRFSSKFNADNLDLIHLLDFAIDETTILFLQGLISEQPAQKIPMGATAEKDQRDFELRRHESYFQTVVSSLAGTLRGAGARQILASAEAEAKSILRDTPIADRPAHIDQLDLLGYEIATLQLTRLVAFLEYEVREVTRRLRDRRSGLLEQMRIRNPPT